MHSEISKCLHMTNESFACEEPSNSNIFPYDAYTLKGKESFN